MNFVSKNSLDDFEFHDARIKLVEFTDGKLTVCAEHLNIHKSALQNYYKTDMEIPFATITFEDFSSKSFRNHEVEITDENGDTFSIDQIIDFKGEKAETRLLSELQHGITVFDFFTLDDGYGMDCVDITPFFTAEFSFASATVEWDEFAGSALYERRKTTE